MTLSTVDADGYPDARVLILKGVAGEAFYLLPAREPEGAAAAAKSASRAYLLLA